MFCIGRAVSLGIFTVLWAKVYNFIRNIFETRKHLMCEVVNLKPNKTLTVKWRRHFSFPQQIPVWIVCRWHIRL